MTNLFKIAIIAAPLAGLIFYYVVMQQSKLDTEIEKESLKFEQEWNEFKAESPFTTNRQKYEERAKVAEQKQKELEEKKKQKEQKIEKFEQNFEKALEEAGKEGRQ